MRARNIKPGFFVNDVLGGLPPLTRILFAGLWVLADREGRLEDRPRRIKAEVLPYDDGADVDAMLNELGCAGFLTRYVVDGTPLIQIAAWKKHQDPHKQERPSELPPPPTTPSPRSDSEEVRKKFGRSSEPVQPKAEETQNDTGSAPPDSPIPDSPIPEPHETEPVQVPPAEPVETVEKSELRLVAQESQGPESQDVQIRPPSQKRAGMQGIGFSAAKLLQGMNERDQRALTLGWIGQHFPGLTPAQAKRWIEHGGTLERAQRAHEAVAEWERQALAQNKRGPGPGGAWTCLLDTLSDDEARDLRAAVQSDKAAYKARTGS